MPEFRKHPAETYPIGVDYTGKAPVGASLVSATWAALDLFDTSDASSTVLASTTAVIEGSIAKARVQSGTLMHRYRLGITALFDTGDILHDDIYMDVTQDG